MLERILTILLTGLLLLLPFSLAVSAGSIQIEIPSEPLIALIAILLFVWAYQQQKLIVSYLKHPISLCALFYLSWMGIGILFSSMPLVSLKSFLVAAAHWWVFFVGFIFFSQKDQEHIIQWFSWYSLAFFPMLLYTWKVHSSYFYFHSHTAVLAARPFYFDHNMYGACMAFLGFIHLGFAHYYSHPYRKLPYYVHSIWTVFLFTGVYLSASRGAWLSTGFAFLFLIVFHFKINIRWIFLMAIGLMLAGFVFSKKTLSTIPGDTLIQKMQLSETFKKDASTLERMNRYSCAWRMFLDRPITGFGAGTFPMQFLDYQRPEEITRISIYTEGPHKAGRGGSTHSEYLKALSELGLAGFLAWVLLAGFAMRSGMQIIYQSKTKKHGIIATYLSLAIMSYLIHAIVNNFLATGKVSVLFWSALAALVILEKSSFRSKKTVRIESSSF